MYVIVVSREVETDCYGPERVFGPFPTLEAAEAYIKVNEQRMTYPFTCYGFDTIQLVNPTE